MAASPTSAETTPSPERVQADQGAHRAEDSRSTSRAGASRSSRAVLMCLGMLCVLLFGNWLVAIGRFQPNVLFSDQWDFFVPLFDGAGLWPQFNRQHGPVREGPGLVITGWILQASDWDVRYDSIWIASILLLATLLALRLKWRMTGIITWRDAWIPVLCLSLGQFETVVTTPSASHSVLPLALILLTANIWLSPRASVRYIGGGILAGVLTFTGFGLFAAAVAGVLLFARVIRHARARLYREMSLALAGALVVVASWLRFLDGYVFQPAVEGFRFPWTPMSDYWRFAVLMLKLPTGETGTRLERYLLGSAIAVVMILTAIRAVRGSLQRRPSRENEVLVLLVGSGLLFVAFTAVGRIPLGIRTGEASRYFSLMVPLWLAVYLAGIRSPRKAVAVTASLGVWLLALWPYGAMRHRELADWPGTLGMTDRQLYTMRCLGATKASWVRAYLNSGSVDTAQSSPLGPIHPAHGFTRLEDKLRFLRERQLLFFAGEPERGDYMPWLADETFIERSC